MIGDVDKREYFAPREGHTVSEICDFYLKQLAVKESTAVSYANNIAMYIRPLLGHRIAKDLTRQDIEAFADKLRQPLEGEFLEIKAQRRACRVASRNFVTGCLTSDVTQPAGVSVFMQDMGLLLTGHKNDC